MTYVLPPWQHVNSRETSCVEPATKIAKKVFQPWDLVEASGRTECELCNQKIERKTTEMRVRKAGRFTGWHYYHHRCFMAEMTVQALILYGLEGFSRFHAAMLADAGALRDNWLVDAVKDKMKGDK